jgi:hypothetical protein
MYLRNEVFSVSVQNMTLGLLSSIKENKAKHHLNETTAGNGLFSPKENYI